MVYDDVCKQCGRTRWFCVCAGSSRFTPKKSDARNETYTPYQDKGSWWYDDAKGRKRGSFIAERDCQEAADKAREREEEVI